MLYTYNKTTEIDSAKVDLVRLEDEITASSIASTLKPLRLDGIILSIEFETELSNTDHDSLTAIVKAHSGEPYPEEVEPQKVSVIQEVAPPPFSNKTLSTGQKLFKRIHGVQGNIAANSTSTIQLTVPYNYAKIDGLEIIGSKAGDTGNFIVYDNALGTISTVPNYKLNQFGFNVCMKPEYHKEESRYDADVIAGMVLELEFTNNQNTDALIGVNFILHEVV